MLVFFFLFFSAFFGLPDSRAREMRSVPQTHVVRRLHATLASKAKAALNPQLSIFNPKDDPSAHTWADITLSLLVPLRKQHATGIKTLLSMSLWFGRSIV